MALKDWSTTPADNGTGYNALVANGGAPEGWSMSQINDWARQAMATVRMQAAENTIASAATTDLGSLNEQFITITGTTTITSFGTVSAGIPKWVTFAGALTLTHNATSLILPGGANIATAAGDCALVRSLGGGNWRCLAYQRADGRALVSQTGVMLSANSLSDVASVPAARTNLGLGTAATKNTGTTSGDVPLVGTISATETLAGLVEIATNAEAQAQTDTTRVITPANLAASMKGANQILNTNGYQKFPGGLILQYGRVGTGISGSNSAPSSGTVTFPIAFTTAVVYVGITPHEPDVLGATQGLTSAFTLTQFSYSIFGATGAASAADGLHWIALGF